MHLFTFEHIGNLLKCKSGVIVMSPKCVWLHILDSSLFNLSKTVVRAASDQCRHEKDIKQSTQNNRVPTVFSACRHKIME